MDREDRFALHRTEPSKHEAEDSTARLAYELATKPPTKDVASIKAASDVYEANLQTEARREVPPRRRSRQR